MSDAFAALLKQRLVIFDGAMGTMIQRHHLSEEQFRGERFKAWRSDLRGNNDLLVITQPQIIAAIHRDYLLAGADIIATNEALLEIVVGLFHRGECNRIRLANQAIARFETQFA